MTLLLLPLVPIVALVAWAAGARPRQIVWGAAIGMAVLLVSSVALAVGLGLEGSDDDDEPARSNPADRVRAVDERLGVTTDTGRFAEPLRPIDGLTDGETRLVEVTGMEAGESGRAQQCTAEEEKCGPALPVQADDDGRVRFLFEFAATVPDDAAGNCRRSPCALVVTGEDRERLVSASLVFGDRVTDGDVRVENRVGLRASDVLAVTLIDFAPGEVTVTLCTPPGPVDATRCGAPAPEVTAILDSTGRADVTLPVHTGDVGEHGGRCGRGHRCAVAVSGRPDIDVVELGFAGSADARPGRAQLIVGFLVAGVLVAVALVALRRGPWTPPGGDPFEGVELDDPFADLDPADDADHPATSRRPNVSEPATTSAQT